jgi:hypothetical protein
MWPGVRGELTMIGIRDLGSGSYLYGARLVAAPVVRVG